MLDDAEIEALGDGAAVVRDGWLGLDRALAAREAAEATALAPAGIGRGRDWHVDPGERADRIAWVERGLDPRLDVAVDAFEALRAELNERAFLSLGKTELQLARYGPGGRYARHRDAFRGERGRRITALWYLNPAWKGGDGGELAVWDPTERVLAPRIDRLVIFRSDAIDHEVRATRADRWALTAWYS